MNKMKEVAQLLGVEIDEEFEIVGKECKYRIVKDGLEALLDSNRWHPTNGNYLVSLIKGTFEIKKPILDKVEKKYLENVIRPFRDRVIEIEKDTHITSEAINIKLESICSVSLDDEIDFVKLPLFKKRSMYKGMTPCKSYTLKELGLFEDE